MKKKTLIAKSMIGFTRNEELDKCSYKVLYKDKVKMATHIFKTVGLP